MPKKIKKSKSPQFSRKTKIFLILGAIFLSVSILYYFNQTIQLAFFTPKTIPVKSSYAIPKQVIIPSVNIDLISEETNIRNGIWEISSNGASHLTTSARPGENGPIIFYGHNTNERFGPIRWLEKDAIIKIKTEDGKIHEYKVTETLTASPKDIDVFTKENGETLILYTCDGFLDLQRFVVIAKPIQ